MQPLPDMNQLLKLAASPAGQQLLSMLQQEWYRTYHMICHHCTTTVHGLIHDGSPSFVAIAGH